MIPNIPEINFGFAFDSLIHLMFLVGFGIYIFFAFIVLRQIQIMRETVVTPFSGFIQLLGFLHFFLAIGISLWAFLILL